MATQTQDKPPIRCRLLGCVPESEPACARCGADIYSGEFVEDGRLERLQYLLRGLRRYVKLRARCEVCGKRAWPWNRHFPYICSEQCYDEWLPF